MKRIPFALVLLMAVPVYASDLDQAIPGFSSSGKTAIPIDFQSVALQLNFDPATKTGIGRCEIEFRSGETGYPILDLVPSVRKVVLNGNDLGAGALPTISSPDNATKMRLLQASVNAGSLNRLEIEYTIPSADVGYDNNGVRMVWAMNDLGDRGFLEKYACANFEFDHFPMSLRVEIAGNPAPHQIFTNGSLEFVRNGLWRIEFPDYFTSSSHYFHISNRAFSLAEDIYPGIRKPIPVSVYGSTTASVTNALQRAKQVLAELEAAYGPYAHDSLTVYLTSTGGGMEHVGATITTLGALDHEITHSWFARGVMPSNGNSGWIDEAIASWRDNGYPRGTASLSGSTANLAGFSAYRRHTPQVAYTAGASLISRFDALFSRGMKATLRDVFSRAQRTTLTTTSFRALLESITGASIDNYFQRYVYGSSRGTNILDALPVLGSFLPESPMISRHPPALTSEEIRAIR